MLAKLAPWQKTLLDAAEYIKANGWRNYGNPAADVEGNDPHCVFGVISCLNNGVISCLNNGTGEKNKAIWHLVDHLGFGLSGDIVNWNDAPERTAADVIKALQEAAL